MVIKKLFLLILIILFGNTAYGDGEIETPEGFKKPKNELFFEEWRAEDPNKYLKAEGDYNGDGKKDYAHVFEHSVGAGMAIFVYLSQIEKDTNLIIKIFDTKEDKAIIKATKKYPKIDFISKYLLYYGIRTIPPGKYTTACGKGYFKCGGEGAEEEEIDIKYDAIDFFHYDAGGNSYFYWDANTKSFKYSWMSG